MRYEDVKAAVDQNLKPQLAYTAAHLLLCILETAGTVTHGTAETENADSLVDINGIVNADTALRRGPQIPFVVISMNVQNRDGGHSREE